MPTKKELKNFYLELLGEAPGVIYSVKDILEKYILTIGKLKVIVDPFIDKIDEREDTKDMWKSKRLELKENWKSKINFGNRLPGKKVIEKSKELIEEVIE